MRCGVSVKLVGDRSLETTDGAVCIMLAQPPSPAHVFDQCTRIHGFHHTRWANCGDRNVWPSSHAMLNRSASHFVELLDELPGPLVVLGDSLLRDFFMIAACLVTSKNVKVVPPRSMTTLDWGRRGVVRLRRSKFGPTLMSYVWWRPIGTHGPDEKSELREAAVILTNLGLTHAHNNSEAAAWLVDFQQWMLDEVELQQRGSFFANEYRQVMQGHHSQMSLEGIKAEYRRRGTNRLPVVALHEQLPAHFPSTRHGEYDADLQTAYEAAVSSGTNRRVCRPHRLPSEENMASNWRYSLVDAFARNNSLPILRFWDRTVDRANDHITPSDVDGAAPLVKRRNGMDCRHWCNPGMTTIEWATETFPTFLRESILPRMVSGDSGSLLLKRRAGKRRVGHPE